MIQDIPAACAGMNRIFMYAHRKRQLFPACAGMNRDTICRSGSQRLACAGMNR